MSGVIIAVLVLVIVYQGIIGYLNKRELLAFMDDQFEQWQTERQQLLDRIQAPSFAEYKQAEVKVIKAQNMKPEDLVPSLKLPLE